MVDSLGDRMKLFYEDRSRYKLTRRVPVIMRLDGRAFHTLLRVARKPYDMGVIYAMQDTAMHLIEQIQGAKCAYVQSDEISILITDYDKLSTEAWFDYNIQKMCSIAASMASVYFTQHYREDANFDCRVFNIPKEEVINYFRWRYKDWLRNSLQMLAQSLYSHRELHGQKAASLHDMCMAVGHNWNDEKPVCKNGSFITKQLDVLTDFNLMDLLDPTNSILTSALYTVED